VVSALIAVNSFGEPGTDPAEVAAAGDTAGAFTAEWESNTTVAVLATNAALDKVGCHLVAQGAHDGFARAIAPAHTRADGDAVVVGATGVTEVDADVVRALAVAAVVDAIGALG
jgi:L-aminopeptidase/D-esterase-like protein